jgi:mannose-6-phosphate isomerase-like protein (cupin superfamily)
MKHSPSFVVALFGVFAGAALVVRAQAPPPAPAQPAATVSPSDTTNERSSIQIDQFIGSPLTSTAHLSHGGLFTRAILRNGNPNVPGPAGAVLEYRTQLAAATLPPKNTTALMKINNQFLFYVVGGEGRLDDGKDFWELRDGISMLIPPDVPRRFTNTSAEPLEMIMVEWPANELARKDILVRDADLLPYCEENAHWNNMSKCLFSRTDGMTGRVLLVMLMPFTMAAPHSHTKGTEEIWTKLTPGSALMLLGSELREMPQYGAFLAPPNGMTWHAQVNTSKTQVEKWLYVAGGSPPPAAGQPQAPAAAPGAGRGGGRGGPANPNLLFRDPAAVEQGTVKGTPLKKG